MENGNVNKNPPIPRPKKYCYDELRLRSIPPGQRRQLYNIASHLGITVNQVVKQNLNKVISAYPEHMRAQPKKEL